MFLNLFTYLQLALTTSKYWQSVTQLFPTNLNPVNTVNAEVRRTTGCSPLSHLVTNRRLRLFGHIARSSPRKDHHRALAACIWQVPPDWKRPAGRLSHTWLRAIEADLGPLNFGLATAGRKATTRDKWRHIVDTATLQRSTLWKKKRSRIAWQARSRDTTSKFRKFNMAVDRYLENC